MSLARTGPLIAFCCLGLGSPSAAQTAPSRPAAPRLKITGSHRTRYEMLSNQARVGFGRRDDLLNLRTVVGVEYHDGNVTAVAELWDSRVYGADRRTPVSPNEVNALEPVQAYLAGHFPDALGRGTSADVQVGRFMLNIGSRRLVAADDYRNTTNGYTGIRIDADAGGGWRGVGIYVLPQARERDDLDGLLKNRVKFDHEGFDLVLWGGVLTKTRAIGPVAVEASFFHVGEHDSPRLATRDRSLETVSLRVFRDPKAGLADGEAELIGQTGTASASTAPGAATLPVRAWFVHADAGYTFDTAWRPRLSVEYDRASGETPDRRVTRFDTLFGMRRADFAPSGLYAATGRANISTPGIRLEAVPSKRTELMANARALWSASRTDSFSTTNVRDATGRSGRFAGVQAEGRLRRRLTPFLTGEIDWVLLRKGGMLRTAPNATPGRWTSYLSLNLTATLP